MNAGYLTYFRGKRVLITGHTGFKGSWLCWLLVTLGAEVTGYSLAPPTEPNLFTLACIAGTVHDIRGDVRDFSHLQAAFAEARPEIVIHLAAQPIVREGYRNPAYTYETNVMGTVNLLECVRLTPGIRSVVNVTTDKVYLNREWEWGYREGERLDGFDPYSNSKSCSELVTSSYRRSFFAEPDSPAVSTLRAGNVIGGGDMAPDRLIPDCVRAVIAGRPLSVRNPGSVRPYQHVLDPLVAYLMVARAQALDASLAGSYNVGPDECDCVTTARLVQLFINAWGEGAQWEQSTEAGPHEARILKLDCSRLKATLQWSPRWHISEAVENVCAWTKVWLGGGDILAEMDREIQAFFNA